MGMFFISCICSVAQTTKTYTIPFNREDFTIINTEHGSYIESDKHDLRLEEDTLKPAIPYINVRILLPDKEVVDTFSYHVESLYEDTTVTLCTNPQYYFMGESTEKSSSIFDYPIKKYPFSVKLSGTEIVDGYSIAVFKIFPISYDPLNQSIKWASNITISLMTKPMGASLDICSTRHDGEMNSLLKRILYNPEDLQSRRMIMSMNLDDNKLDYLIITADSLKEYFKPLVDWKTVKGVKAEIISIEDIYNNYDGQTNQLKIKSFLYDYKTSKNLKYVLLGGDDCIIPVQGCYGKNGSKIDYTIPADLFYACFQGRFDWNADGDSLVGETTDSVEYNPELYCSRIPIRDATSIKAFVNRVIAYEQVQKQYFHYNKLLMSGVKAYELNDDGQSDTELKGDYVYETFIKDYWPEGSLTRFYDTSTDFVDNYDYDVTWSNLQEQFELGYFFINIASHGTPSSWLLENSWYFVSNAQSLQCEYPMIITTSACLTNAFDANSSNLEGKGEPCLSEAFMRNPNSNVLAYLGGSRSGWTLQSSFPSKIGASERLNAYFYNELFSDSVTNFAKIVANAKIRLGKSGGANKWIQYSVNPLGDPEMPIFTTNPQVFNNVNYSFNDRVLHVNAGVSGCQITLTGKDVGKNDFFQTYKETSYTSFSDLANGEYTLCITKHNYKPFLLKICIGTEYLQNEVVSDCRLYLGNSIQIGNNVTTSKPTGTVVIQSGASVTINVSGNTVLDKGTIIEKGAIFDAK